MRIARGLEVLDVGEDGVRVEAADWPWAGWTSVVGFAPGAPLAVWSAATRHWIELGGAAVFCAFGATCAGLAMSRRRAVEIHATADGVTLAGVQGAGPFRRDVARWFGPSARVEVRPFPTPDGAPELPDRGGDLLLVGDGAEELLARSVGPGWKPRLDAARARVVTRIPRLA